MDSYRMHDFGLFLAAAALLSLALSAPARIKSPATPRTVDRDKAGRPAHRLSRRLPYAHAPPGYRAVQLINPDAALAAGPWSDKERR
jgi:hypothetical protein